MNLNWVALISIAIKYGPSVIAFVQSEGPQIRAFIADVEAALAAAQETHTAPTMAGTGPNMPTLGPGGTFTS